MLQVTINGRIDEFPEGTTILGALNRMGIEVPTLCHDPRIAPIGACRLCVVQVTGAPKPLPACSTPLTYGMHIQTHTPELEESRRTNLRLLAARYPDDALRQFPEQPFHRLLRAYGVDNCGEGRTEPSLADQSHPYIRVDMARCIYCFRCIRICSDLQGQFVWRAWNRGDATRILPDSNTTLLESSCVACGACVDTCPTGALQDRNSDGAPNRWTKTVCPYCGVGCEMHVGTRDNRIISIKPVLEAPVNKGHLCVKGRYAFDFIRSPQRITEPMIRRQGQWIKATWDEAIEAVAEGLKRTIDRHGPQSVGMLGSARGTNEENYLAQKFARTVLATNNIDCCARVCHAPSAAAMKQMLGTGAATNSFDDIEQARTILVCGSNATENHPVVGARIKQAALRGANLIVIDPRKIELAHYANYHLPVHPGTNVALLNAMACSIIEDGFENQSAIVERVSGWAEFRSFISTWTPEKIGPICGLNPELIRAAARLYATATPAMCFHGLGVTEHLQGTEGVMCLVNLALITGNFGKPGSGVNPLRGQNNVQGSAHMGCEPAHLTGLLSIQQGCERFEQIWRSPIPVTPGLNLMQMMEAAVEGKFKALWAIGYDIGLTNPNFDVTAKALQSLDFLVVQDPVLCESAQFASVLLPAAFSYEKDGTFMNAERRVQRVRKVLDPPALCKPDWEIICQAARAMGKGDLFDFHSAKEIWEEIRSTWPAGHGITYERLEHGGLQWPCPTPDHPGTPFLHAESFPTSKRAMLERIDFHPTTEAVSDEFPLLLITGRTLYQFNAGTMTMQTPDRQLRGEDLLDISPEDAAALALQTGDEVRLCSRYGKTRLPIQINPAMNHGQLFATFHTPQACVNRVTTPQRDNRVDTPEYKITAVRLEKL